MKKTATQIAMEEQHKGKRQYFAMRRMLDELMDWVYPTPRNEGDRMPIYKLHWETGVDDGPAKIIEQAIAECPELWEHAIPKECVIVCRKHLEKFVLPTPTLMDIDDCVHFLAAEGSQMVANKAAKIRYEREQKERFERWKLADIDETEGGGP